MRWQGARMRWQGLAVVAAALLVAGMTLSERAGSDASEKALCHGREATIVGTPGPDASEDERLFGTSGNDVIVTLANKDQIHARAGNDLICGRRGGDLIQGGKGHDHVYGGSQQDGIVGGPAGDRLHGNGGQDLLEGGRGFDVCHGDSPRPDRPGRSDSAGTAAHSCDRVRSAL